MTAAVLARRVEGAPARKDIITTLIDGVVEAVKYSPADLLALLVLPAATIDALAAATLAATLLVRRSCAHVEDVLYDFEFSNDLGLDAKLARRRLSLDIAGT